MGHSFRSLLIGSSLLIAVALAGTAAAESVSLHWDDCNSFSTNKQFAGPAVYRQVLSGWGYDAPMRGYSIRMRITNSNVYNQPYAPPGEAWRFDPAGCNAGRAAASTSVQSCPVLGTGTSVVVTYDGSAVRVTLTATHDVVDPLPNLTYVLGEIAYDHSASAVGQNPGLCGNAEVPACFVIEAAEWYDAENVAHPINFELFTGVSWQDPTQGHCFGDLPVQAVPWTAVKRLYD
jgi:hypothetical protein